MNPCCSRPEDKRETGPADIATDKTTREVQRRIESGEKAHMHHPDRAAAGLGLTDVPPEVERLTTLKVLDLGENRLTGLPPVVFRLPQLIHLSLRDNPIGVLSPDAGRLGTLDVLNLSGTRLTSVPPDIGRL